MHRSGFLSLLFAVLPALAQTGSPDPTGIVTIFHEPAGYSVHAWSGKTTWPKNIRHKLLMDGKPLAFMQGPSFVSFRVPAGRHSVVFDTMSTSSADFELHPGERVFVYTGFQFGMMGSHFSTSVISCEQAVSVGQGTQPMDRSRIERTDALDEPQFPARCEGDEKH